MCTRSHGKDERHTNINIVPMRVYKPQTVHTTESSPIGSSSACTRRHTQVTAVYCKLFNIDMDGDPHTYKHTHTYTHTAVYARAFI